MFDDCTFQSTPPRRGRLIARYIGIVNREFQSTPPRRGRLGVPLNLAASTDVSIHAPAQGATHGRDNEVAIVLFQSTPPRRGRPTGVRRSRLMVSFNPRPRAGGDSIPQMRDRGANVSIHAPAQGATGCSGALLPVDYCFNPRPRAGGDTNDKYSIVSAYLFQSTPPRRGRQR